MDDLISRQDAIDALWKALYEYEDRTEKQFIESDDLDVADWIQHRIFVQNMNDLDKKAILNIPSAQPEREKWIPAFDGMYTGGAYWFKCSGCGYMVTGGLQSGNYFCRNCGADMRGEQDGWMTRYIDRPRLMR